MKTFKQWLYKENNLSIQDLAKDFYDNHILKHPEWSTCELGVPRSGNCAWFAREFYNWAKQNNLNPKIILFPWSQKEEQAHIVPVINGYIVDYIQEFTGRKPYLIFPIGNPQINEKQPLFDENKTPILPANTANHYSTWYDHFIYADTIQRAEQVIREKGHGESDVKDFEINTFEPPDIKKSN